MPFDLAQAQAPADLRFKVFATVDEMAASNGGQLPEGARAILQSATLSGIAATAGDRTYIFTKLPPLPSLEGIGQSTSTHNVIPCTGGMWVASPCAYSFQLVGGAFDITNILVGAGTAGSAQSVRILFQAIGISGTPGVLLATPNIAAGSIHVASSSLTDTSSYIAYVEPQLFLFP